MADDNGGYIPLSEGKVCKGGQNPPNTSSKRPRPPMGSGGCAALSVMAPGSSVEIGPESDPIRATVKQVCLNGENIDYEVVWWNGGTRTTAWLTSGEVRPGDATKFRPMTRPRLLTAAVFCLLMWGVRFACAQNIDKTGVIYWSFDEASGNAADSNSGGNVMVETSGTIDRVAGKLGNAADFESGDTEYFELADNAATSTGASSYTFGYWVFAESLPAFACPIAKGWPGDGVQAEYINYVNSSQMRWEIRGPASTGGSQNATTLSTGTWYFIVCVHDAAADTLTTYVNASGNTPVSWANGSNDGNRAMWIGASPNQSLYWDGLIDEAFFVKRALSGSEITWLYNSGNGRTFAEWSSAAPRAMALYRMGRR